MNLATHLTQAETEAALGTTQTVQTTETWLKAHERLILITLGLLLALFLGNKYLDHAAAHDKQVADLAAQQLDAQRQQNTQLAAQVQQTASQYQALVQSLTQQNAQLAASIQTRTIVLQQQVKTDQNLPLPDLGSRWASLAGIQPADITASSTGISVSSTGARQTVEQLEQVPALQANVRDLQQESDNKQTELAKADDLIGGLNTQVTGLETTVSLEDKTCKAEIASVKATERKSKLHVFLTGLGVGAGLVGGLALHLF